MEYKYCCFFSILEKTHTIAKADIGEPIPQTDDAENGMQQPNESLVLWKTVR